MFASFRTLGTENHTESLLIRVKWLPGQRHRHGLAWVGMTLVLGLRSPGLIRRRGSILGVILNLMATVEVLGLMYFISLVVINWWAYNTYILVSQKKGGYERMCSNSNLRSQPHPFESSCHKPQVNWLHMFENMTPNVDIAAAFFALVWTEWVHPLIDALNKPLFNQRVVPCHTEMKKAVMVRVLVWY